MPSEPRIYRRSTAAMPLSLSLLGGATLQGSAGPLRGPASQRHRLALLAVLAAHHPRPVSREKAAALLWPERDREHARALLSQAVHALRRELGETALGSGQQGLEFRPEAVLCDLVEFRRALGSGELECAVRLHAGPFLDGFFLDESVEFERWSEQERRRISDDWAEAVEAVACEAERREDPIRAVRWWRALAAHDPLDSRIAVRLMAALDAAGNPAGALKHEAEHAVTLRDEIGVQPPESVRALADFIRRRGCIL